NHHNGAAQPRWRGDPRCEPHSAIARHFRNAFAVGGRTAGIGARSGVLPGAALGSTRKSFAEKSAALADDETRVASGPRFGRATSNASAADTHTVAPGDRAFCEPDGSPSGARRCAI